MSRELEAKVVAAVAESAVPLFPSQIIALNLDPDRAAVYLATYNAMKDGRLARLGNRGSYCYTTPERAKDVEKLPPQPAVERARHTRHYATDGAAARPAAPPTEHPLREAIALLKERRDRLSDAITILEEARTK